MTVNMDPDLDLGPEPDPDLAIEVHDLRCRYGTFEAVRGIDLTVRRGEIFALLGTNGAGKTTTLEVLGGFHRRHAGTVRVLGVDPNDDSSALRARIGFTFQEGALLDELTVDETLRLWGRLVERVDRPERLLERFELTGRRYVATGKLSGGERRRLDLALAVWGTPDLVILDEPTTGLDPESRRQAWDAIGELTEAGRTVLMTTHYLEEAEALADHLAIMHEGRIAVSGTLAEIVAARPAGFSATATGITAAELPTLQGEVAFERTEAGATVRVWTRDLQADLTRFLGWAAEHGVRLEGLRAAPAGLDEVYHAIRNEKSDQSDQSDLVVA